MTDNQHNLEASGERIPSGEGNLEAVKEIDPQYEAGVLEAVALSQESVPLTPEIKEEIKTITHDVQVELGGAPSAPESLSPAQLKKQERNSAAESLEGKKFAFPGISEKYGTLLKTERDEMQEYYTSTWDELMDKFTTQGARVHTGKNGEIHIMPAESTDIENDSLFPRYLVITDDMDENLKKLILANTK